MNYVLSEPTATRLKEVLATLKGTHYGRGGQEGVRLLIFVRVTGAANADGFYPCVPEQFLTADSTWDSYGDCQAWPANGETLAEGTRYLAIRAADSDDGIATFVTACCVGDGGFETTVTTGGTITLDADSATVQQFTGIATETVVLPDVSTLTVGTTYVIENRSTSAITVKSSDATSTVAVVPSGQDATFTVISTTGTTPASWDHAFTGSTTSFPTSTSTATSGTTTTLTVDDVQTQYFTGSSNQTVVMPVTSTLPLYRPYEVVNLSTGTLTVESSGGGTIAIVPSGAKLSLTNISTSGTTPTSWDYKFTGTTSVPSVTITPTAAGTTTLTALSTQTQQFTGSTTQTVILPVVSTLPLGTPFRILNDSTGTVTVESSGGNTVTTLAAGDSATVTSVSTSGTTAASWQVQKITAPTGGGISSAAWTSYSKTYADFSFAGASHNFTIATLPAKTVILWAVAVLTQQFSGGSISGYTIGLQTAKGVLYNGSPLDGFVSPSGSTFTDSTNVSGQGLQDYVSSSNVTATVSSSGDTLNHATAGAVEIRLLLTTLP